MKKKENRNSLGTHIDKFMRGLGFDRYLVCAVDDTGKNEGLVQVADKTDAIRLKYDREIVQRLIDDGVPILADAYLRFKLQKKWGYHHGQKN